MTVRLDPNTKDWREIDGTYRGITNPHTKIFKTRVCAVCTTARKSEIKSSLFVIEIGLFIYT